MWVHDCYVSPEYGTGEKIVDTRGYVNVVSYLIILKVLILSRCSVDQVVLGDLDYGQSPHHLVTGQHHAYSFADYPTLLFRCTISVCDSENPTACRFLDGSPVSVVLLYNPSSPFSPHPFTSDNSFAIYTPSFSFLSLRPVKE